MIVEMTRYDFLLYHRDVPQFLEHLRELGLVDITLNDFTPNEQQKTKIDLFERYRKVESEMASIKVNKSGGKPKKGKITLGNPFDTADQAVEQFESATAEIARLESAIVRARAEMTQLEAWGEFDVTEIDRLKNEGVVLRFFETSPKSFRLEWEHIYAIEVIERTSSKVFFVVACTPEEATQTLELDAIELPAPQSSYAQKEVEIEDLIARQVDLQKVVARAAGSRQLIKDKLLEMQDEIDYIMVENSGEMEIDGTLKVLEGWSEAKDRAKIEEFAAAQEVYFMAEKPVVEQNPPIKLKNNFFSRLFEPIGALYMLPRYNELDMTPFFAPFFMIFFGMCFADAGYGILLILATIVMWKKIPSNLKDIGWLMIFLNFSAVVVGLFTGNVFGLELARMPQLVEFKQFFLTPDNLFTLSIAMGALQIIFAMIIKVFNKIKKGGGFIYGISTIGWLILILSSVVALSGLVPEYFASDSLAYEVTAWFGVGLILLFTVPKKPLASIGKGLYSFYETATGVIGDLISYVRLFAIGLSGTIIAQVFNELSVGLSGDIPVVSFLVMAIILFVGHFLNIFISMLGAIVHPIRLTFVEFYKNADFEGGGRKFTPFKRSSVKQ